MFFYSSVQVNPRILNWGSLHIVYNAVATTYNKKIKRFPTSIYAGLFGYEKVELFQATNDAATTVPSVDLSDKE
ncbi:LemA family protein [Streptococcus suis]|uniref:LemA family protein n=1 Tax=Streptococcus suis TaxID=1307 RepID=UPI00240FE630|nr:LemA family protein [Streptococcus suis]